jgi:hypothetical protein
MQQQQSNPHRNLSRPGQHNHFPRPQSLAGDRYEPVIFRKRFEFYQDDDQ